MPYPAQINRNIIVQTAHQLIESQGIEQLSLAQVATKLGVKAPSLYRHMSNKADLIQAVNLLTAQKLLNTFATAAYPQEAPQQQLEIVSTTYRSFAHTYPRTYTLMMTNDTPLYPPDQNVLEKMIPSIQATITQATGKPTPVAALRGLLALIHGFVILELHGQFQRSADLNTTFHQSVQAYITGWQTPP